MMTTEECSVAGWLSGVRRGDPMAAQQLWERYFDRLVQLANDRLPSHARRSFDGEDVALSAVRCFLGALGRGRYPDLQDSSGLWTMLVVITARKATSYVRRQNQEKRGGGEVRGESALHRPGEVNGEQSGLEQVIGDEPTPEFACQVAEECQRLIEALEDEKLQAIAVLRMEGYTVEEIASRLGTAQRTVERRLQMIRTCWQEVTARA